MTNKILKQDQEKSGSLDNVVMRWIFEIVVDFFVEEFLERPGKLISFGESEKKSPMEKDAAGCHINLMATQSQV